MNGYINPEIFIPANAIGIDDQLKNIQLKLAMLGPIQKIFGRAYLQRDVTQNRNLNEGPGTKKVVEKVIFAPYCYLKNNEPINVMPNDNLISQSFFFVHDPQLLQDEGPLVETIFNDSKASLIIWGDITKIANENPESIKIKVLRMLKEFPNIVLLEMFESFDRVYDRFTLTDQMINYNKLPYFALRIDFRIKFPLTPENCI